MPPFPPYGVPRPKLFENVSFRVMPHIHIVNWLMHIKDKITCCFFLKETQQWRVLNRCERRWVKNPPDYFWSKAALFSEAKSSPSQWQRALIHKCVIIVSPGAARFPGWPSDLHYLLTVSWWLYTDQIPRGSAVSKQQTGKRGRHTTHNAAVCHTGGITWCQSTQEGKTSGKQTKASTKKQI